ncbi:hypothetical protein Gogos_006923, partial [Gossypium gossypioides]|nr:hypothetical protein [Gossypium gossypioides]
EGGDSDAIGLKGKCYGWVANSRGDLNGWPRWDCGSPMTLTYAFLSTDMIDYISLPKIKTVFKRSFSMWASIIPVNSTEIDDYPMANIRIEVFKNERFHLYEDEMWAIDFEKVKLKGSVELALK